MLHLLGKSPKEYKNLLIIRLLQSTLLSFYFISGLWKLRDLGFTNWGSAALEHMSYAIAEGNGPSQSIQQALLIDYPWVSVMGFTAVLIFQLSTLIPVITLRYFSLWGIGSICFHASTGIALGIWFTPTVLASLLFLILFENLIHWEKEPSEPI